MIVGDLPGTRMKKNDNIINLVLFFCSLLLVGMFLLDIVAVLTKA